MINGEFYLQTPTSNTIIPKIKRARGYRLYDYGGKRYIDCYQSGGAALLGHRGGRVTVTLKNVISKGLIFDLPSVYSERVKKAVRILLPHFPHVAVYRNMSEAANAISVEPFKIADPVIERREDIIGNHSSAFAVWRPFLDIEWTIYDTLFPLFPFSVAGSPVVVCTKVEKIIKKYEPDISPMLLAGLARSIYDLKKYQYPIWVKDAFPEDPPGWKRRGIYFTSLSDRERYEEIFKSFLDEGVLISPVYPGPTIIPGEVSGGEMKKIVRLFNKFPGK